MCREEKEETVQDIGKSSGDCDLQLDLYICRTQGTRDKGLSLMTDTAWNSSIWACAPPLSKLGRCAELSQLSCAKIFMVHEKRISQSFWCPDLQISM